MRINPLSQFAIYPYIRVYNSIFDLAFTNLTLILILLLIIILINSNIKDVVTYNNNENVLKKTINFIEIEVIKEEKDIIKYLPVLINMTMFILLSNIISLIPYSFTITSQISLIGFITLNTIAGITINGLLKKKFKFFLLFIPQSLNKGKMVIILPLIFIIEVISYLSRIISLSARLIINMLAGHILLKISAIFLYGLLINSNNFYLLLILLIIPIILLETAIAFIQTYIFILLISNYLKDGE